MRIFIDSKRVAKIALAGAVLVFCIACAEKPAALASNNAIAPNIASNMASPAVSSNTSEPAVKNVSDNSLSNDVSNADQQTPQLEKLLAAADFKAIDEAKRLGSQALPVIRKFLKDSNFQVRQIAVSAAGATEDAQAADIMSAGLRDANINVRIAAARELAVRPYPGAVDTVLDILKNGSEDIIRELLATAAGHLPGQKTVETLRTLVGGDSVLSDKAVYALAKLRDSVGRKAFSAKLSSSAPKIRYEALENLCYVNDPGFVPIAKKLLSDKSVGLTIGSARNPKYRKVADQAVDALVCILKLKPSFQTLPESIYTDPQIAEIRDLAK